MCRNEIDHILKKLETTREPAQMRRLLQQADACRTCPEKDLLDRGFETCRCLTRFRIELKNRLEYILNKKESFHGRNEMR
jgi:hypothetical protein